MHPLTHTLGIFCIVLATLTAVSTQGIKSEIWEQQYAGRKLLQGDAPPPVHQIQFGVPLEQLECNAIAQGLSPKRTYATAQFDVARFLGPNTTIGVPLFDFYVPIFYDPSTGVACPFGPTLRVKRGGQLRANLRNNMVTGIHNTPNGNATNQLLDSTVKSWTQGSNLESSLVMNLHAHGLYGSPGVFQQAIPSSYAGQDNILWSVGPRPNLATSPQNTTWYYDIPTDHMPGFSFIHPHIHGSTGLTVGTCSIPYIIEDDPAFLPDSGGCSALRNIIANAKDVVLHTTMTNFAVPSSIPNPTLPLYELIQQGLADNSSGIIQAFLDAPNIQYLEEGTLDPMTTCCGSTPYNFSITPGDDLILINGGYQPTITVPQNGWQRWRILNAGIQPVLSFAIVQHADATLAPNPLAPCKMLLISKDNVYMMKIPRNVSTAILGSGNRAEILVSCSGSVGTAYYLVSGALGPGRNPSFPNPQGVLPGCVDPDGGCDFFKGVAATIVVGNPDATSSLPVPADETCTPLRSNYVADMREVSDNRVVTQPLEMTDLDAFGCNMQNTFFSLGNAPFNMTMGRVHQINTKYANHHSFHIHIQPYQLHKLEPSMAVPGTLFTNFFKEGDFHDSLMAPMFDSVVVPLRLNPGGAKYSGYAVAHCHVLAHEDEGCIILVKVACPGYTSANAQPQVCTPGVVSPVIGTFNPNARSPPPPPAGKAPAAAPVAQPVLAPVAQPVPAPAPTFPPPPPPSPPPPANRRSPPPPPSRPRTTHV